MLKKVIKNIGQWLWNDDGKTGILQFDLSSMLKIPDVTNLQGMFQEFADMFSIENILGKIGRKLEKQDWGKFGGWAKNLLLKVFDPKLGLTFRDTGAYMAKGGPFRMSQPFIAGEKGPEAVLPSTSGLVVNRNLTQAILKAGLDRAAGGGTAGGGGGGGQMIITNAPTIANTSYVDQTISTKRHLPNISAIS